MNDDNLERELRSQRGPREAGYVPVPLPMTPDEGPVGNRRPSRLPRAMMLVAAGAAGALAVAFAAGVFSGTGPEVGSSSTTPSAEASAAPGTCGPDDVTLEAEPWGGAAGSRGTLVTISLADGRDACVVIGAISAQIKDANGSVLVDGESAGAGESVSLEPGSAPALSITWSNWCGPSPAAPVGLWVALEGWPSALSVTVPDGTDPVPLCLGASVPSSLSVADLER
ncbi:MAG TPA: DUF4232 domain-containing protein [Candidatus Limnocylindria bacterium]|jgi:hypothetical protein|nr:DUF4232 domain-containing protein [Candidatus Limnocylindria bacterium]